MFCDCTQSTLIVLFSRLLWSPVVAVPFSVQVGEKKVTESITGNKKEGKTVPDLYNCLSCIY